MSTIADQLEALALEIDCEEVCGHDVAARIRDLIADYRQSTTPAQAPAHLLDIANDIEKSRNAPAQAAEPVAEQRLRWLHSQQSMDVDGYEWGIFRVKWVNGKAAEVWQTNSDFSDLDAAMGVRTDRCKHGVRYPHECSDCIYEDAPAATGRWPLSDGDMDRRLRKFFKDSDALLKYHDALLARREQEEKAAELLARGSSCAWRVYWNHHRAGFTTTRQASIASYEAGFMAALAATHPSEPAATEREGMTEEQIHALEWPEVEGFDTEGCNLNPASVVAFVRAIEAAHRIPPPTGDDHAN